MVVCKCTAAAVLCVLVTILATVALAARKHSPLLEDNALPKKPSRVTECQFGKQLKEIGSTWYADLGPPFGVMYCIKCECVQVQKKRRIIGRVQCRNIKNDCPKPNCEEPILLPGKCCKSCPGDEANDFVQDPPDDEEKSMKHFAAILTGQSSRSGDPKKMDFLPTSAQETGLDYVATGRFTFYRKHLYFSFYTNKPDRPKTVQFVDTNGNIIEEIVSPPTARFLIDAVAEHHLSEPDWENLRRLASRVQRLQAVVARRKDVRVAGLGYGNHRRSSLQVSSVGHRNIQLTAHRHETGLWWYEHRFHIDRIAVHTHANHVQRPVWWSRHWIIFGQTEVCRERAYRCGRNH
uniref:Dorsal-ventral patterning protein Sog n=1 Tax=Sipha flava TaxID=143950 RepID=A0A2S2Q7I8_9HEMI